MSLFDIIKYGDIDIESVNDLNRLPPEVVKKWHARVVEHSCQTAESIAHQDKSGSCQKLIDSIRMYMRGEVDYEWVKSARRFVSDVYTPSTDAARSAAIAAASMYYAIEYASSAVYYSVIGDGHTADEAYCAAYTVATAMFKEWLMEELMNHESD